MDIVETETVKIVLNGETRLVPPRLNLQQLLTWLEIDPARVAVEYNRGIVRKETWTSTMIAEGDNLEVVWFVGGGR